MIPSSSLPLFAAALKPVDGVALVAYFALIVSVGLWAGKFCKTTQDFFFGGRRFGWWLVAVSCIATLVGSYSFLQYSELGFKYGLCSMYQYTNEWFVLPIFLLAWLPITYYSRVQSIPEYFERRFDGRTRMAVLVVLLVYLEIYIGINLLTIGRALHGVYEVLPSASWDILFWATVMAVVSALYLHAGGQTSVILTDLLQGLLLLIIGLVIFFLGIQHVGGFERFWEGLPENHRLPFAQFNRPSDLHAVGVYWDDAMVGTFAFYIINQGVLMRFLSAKSVRDGRKAMLVVVIVLMPLVAVSVSGAGWVGRAMATHKVEPLEKMHQLEQVDPKQYTNEAREVFVNVARAVCRPGLFGLVIAAVIAALMSTLDTLIAAVSAVAVNDIWRKVRPDRDDAYYLHAARQTAIVVTLLGLGLIPVLDQYDTIYQALTAFTSLILPPLIVVTALAITWKGFPARAAFWTLILGSGAMLLSWKGLFPQIITPLAHGVELDPDKPYVFMRAFFGLVVSTAIALILAALDRRRTDKSLDGLVIETLEQGRTLFKGAAPNDRGVGRSVVLPFQLAKSLAPEEVRLPRWIMEQLEAEPGDLVFLSDPRWWLSGFRSVHAKLGPALERGAAAQLTPQLLDQGNLLPGRRLRVEKIM